MVSGPMVSGARRYATGAAPPMGMKPDSQRPPPKAGTREPQPPLQLFKFSGNPDFFQGLELTVHSSAGSGTPQGSGASGGGVAGANTAGVSSKPVALSWS